MALADPGSPVGNAELGDLYRRYAKWLTVIVRRRGGGDASEDIVQETYARIAKMSADQAIRHPKALLVTVARRLLMDDRRSAVRAAAWAAETADLEASGANDEQFETVLLKQIILSLPTRYRDVFVLHRFGGMSYEAIARARGLSVKAVEWRVTRAMAICDAKLGEQAYG